MEEYKEINVYVEDTSEYIKCPVCNEIMKMIDYKGQGVVECYCNNCKAHRYMQNKTEVKDDTETEDNTEVSN